MAFPPKRPCLVMSSASRCTMNSNMRPLRRPESRLPKTLPTSYVEAFHPRLENYMSCRDTSHLCPLFSLVAPHSFRTPDGCRSNDVTVETNAMHAWIKELTLVTTCARGLQREREKICVYGIGQQFVEYQRHVCVCVCPMFVNQKRRKNI